MSALRSHQIHHSHQIHPLRDSRLVSPGEYSNPTERQERHLRLVWSRPEPLARHIYLRRRVLALVLLVCLSVSGYAGVNAGVNWGASASPAPAVVEPISSSSVRVVQPGDTLWSIATASVSPGTDVRPIVAEMSKALGGKALMPGDRVPIPPFD